MIDNPAGVLVDQRVLAKVREIADRSSYRHEVGGILIGCRRGSYLHVVDASSPQPRDRASPVRFWRSPIGHQAFAAAAWRRSKGHVGYLGEWHSHAEDHPSPSTIDRGSWSKTYRLHQRPLVNLIVGQKTIWISVQTSSAPAAALMVVEADADGQLFAVSRPGTLLRNR